MAATKTSVVVDLGCGSFPTFLSSLHAPLRIGMERFVAAARPPDIAFIAGDLTAPYLPLKDQAADVVTMLAVAEHLDPPVVDRVFAEVHRVLRSDGCFIVTTPARWTAPLLWILARLRMVSPSEINEHEHGYTRAELHRVLARAGFGETARAGYFDLGLNLYGTGGR